jgi:hypothetical protein
MIAAGLVTAILLFVVGTLMEHNREAKFDREDRKRWPRDEYGVDEEGSHYPLDGRW